MAMAKVRERLLRTMQSRSLQGVARNAGWLMAERVATLLLNVGVSVWMARYLGPEAFGGLNYAIALVGLFAFIPYLGLDGLVTRRLVEEPENRDELLGTTVALRLAAGTAAAVLIGAVSLLRPGAGDTGWLVAVVAAGMVFDAFNSVDFWFQSRVESRYAVQARTAAVAIGAALRVAMILSRAPLVAFAAAATLQQAVQAAGLLYVYRRQGYSLRRWRVVVHRARALVGQSWPLILSSAGSLIYLKIDQVMLGEMVGAREVGTYAVAARLSELWYFIPTTIGTSLLPMMVESKRMGEEAYQRRLQQMYVVMAWAGIVLAAGVSLTAGPMMDLMYGPQYHGAGRILQIHIWTCPGIFMGAILSRWLVVEDLLTFSLTRNLVGAVVNVALNLVLIPRYGAAGAAVATLASYTAATYLACFTDRRTWRAGLMMTRALFAPFRLRARAA
ncbi:flippase [Longimicrobium sp.]|uniref:flippase n=1 Tax=Longimicrobium sp. TaxID=2029185 RepID=UPI002CBB1364|nr:flippase [Longimicrobium sp.]HSU17099.1 flippase [Longimicrobium sp.]